MDGAKIGDDPWGCLLGFAIFGLVAVIYTLYKLVEWLINHVSIS